MNDALLDQARREARKRGQTLTALIEESLRQELVRARDNGPRPKVELPVGNTGGLMPGVDLNDSAGLLAIMEEGLPIEKLR